MQSLFPVRCPTICVTCFGTNVGTYMNTCRHTSRGEVCRCRLHPTLVLCQPSQVFMEPQLWPGAEPDTTNSSSGAKEPLICDQNIMKGISLYHALHPAKSLFCELQQNMFTTQNKVLYTLYILTPIPLLGSHPSWFIT